MGLLLVLAGLTGCDSPGEESPAPESSDDGVASASRDDDVAPEVVETITREPTFTQGLETLPDGSILHSRGMYGASGIDILSSSGEVIRSRDLPADEFGEGVTVVPGADGAGATAYQLTWMSGVVHTWSVPDLEPGPLLRIDGEGWGLCYDATREVLWQSDGSSRLRSLRLPDLQPLGSVPVTEQGTPIDQLNELECLDGTVWANVWRSNDLVSIDPDTGRVGRRVELDALARAEGTQSPDDVLNGIARGEQDTLVVTGKNWAHLYRIDVSAPQG
ncbi:MAG: glutaminyl-peptide cyclotransferase [Ornithinimicrobium sp.]